MENNGCCAKPASCGTAPEKKEGSCGDAKSSCETKSGCGDKKDCAPKSDCCVKGLKGALIGGIIMFAWLSASWMFLPFHMKTLHGFTNEAAVAQAISAGAPQSGVYLLPFVGSPDQKPAVDKPFAFVSVKAEGFDPAGMGPQMGKQFLLCFLLAGILTCMLKKMTCGCPVGFSVKVGFLVALAHNLPSAIWWHFPADFTLVSFADDVIAFGLAGLAISKCVLAGCKTDKGSCGAKTDCSDKKDCGEKKDCGTEKKGGCGTTSCS